VLAAEGGLTFGDFYEFAEALSWLLDDEPLRRTLAARGRAYVERECAWPHVTARLCATLERLNA
jgi:glycosyltransferase involved in cell wall biosynthesis